MTIKKQLTLRKAITRAVGETQCYEVQALAGQITPTPVRIQRADAVRAKLAELAITERDVGAAVEWVRKSRAKTRA